MVQTTRSLCLFVILVVAFAPQLRANSSRNGLVTDASSAVVLRLKVVAVGVIRSDDRLCRCRVCITWVPFIPGSVRRGHEDYS
jgi:hypothetical protein